MQRRTNKHEKIKGNTNQALPKGVPAKSPSRSRRSDDRGATRKHAQGVTGTHQAMRGFRVILITRASASPDVKVAAKASQTSLIYNHNFVNLKITNNEQIVTSKKVDHLPWLLGVNTLTIRSKKVTICIVEILPILDPLTQDVRRTRERMDQT